MPSSNTDVEKFIIDGADFPIVDPTARTAIGTTFNNTGTNISATTTEGAIKEVNNSLTQLINVESKELTFTNSVATLAKKTGYVLLQVYGIRPINETGAGYHIDGWIASSDGDNYYIHNSVSNLNAGLSCRLIWLKV